MPTRQELRRRRLAHRDAFADSETADMTRGVFDGPALWFVMLPAALLGAGLSYVVTRRAGIPFSWALTVVFSTLTLNVAIFLLRRRMRTRRVLELMKLLNLSAAFLAGAVWLAETVMRG